MDRPDIVKKDISDFTIKPNMDNYDSFCEDFSWDLMKKEIEFFVDGSINAAHIAVDRHVQRLGDKVAFHIIGEDWEKHPTYKDISLLSNKFANVLKKQNIEKGDRVFIFLPRIEEMYISFLGILKTGAIASTLFAAFGPDALLDRLSDSGAKILVTDSSLKERIKDIRNQLPELKKVIVVGDDAGDDIHFWDEMNKASDKFDVEHMDPKDPAYMLYTSGTTGKPKGVVHTHYDIVQQHLTTKWILDLHKDDVYWCTADPGWVTGIVYGILGPLSNGVTSVVDARRFSAEKWYGIINDYKVTVWYTAPTAIRMMMKEGSDITSKYDLSSLRHLASVGEPLNPEAIWWGIDSLGLAFHDNWWQTETGGILIANYASMNVKVGSMGRPFPGVKAAVVDENGVELPVNTEGDLVIMPGWPSMMIGIWNNKEKYDSYFNNGWYYSGDRARMDDEGYFWFVGRADDVINSAGHRVGPFEVESALVEHPAITEAGVIGKPDDMYGEIIKAFISLKKGHEPSDELKQEIKTFIKGKLAGHAYPKEIEFRDNLPKTRSGKIMRRVLKCQEMGLPVGDTSTLED
ncbi:acetate--CoA ligase [Candidatus Woesearchaeota archaeon]|nr:acetate--CoA ligase [Candidatus Woesearchaeota archaeon]